MNAIDHLLAVMDEAFDPHWREAWTRKQVEDSLDLPTTYFLLANHDGDEPTCGDSVAGFVLARRVLDEEELLLIGVKPEARQKGIGNKLMRRFLCTAYRNGARKVFLEMRDRNEAENLYRGCGFEPIGRRKAYYRTATGEMLDAITFGREL